MESTEGSGGDETKAKLFISYSRKDILFIDKLEVALKARGFEPLIDRSEIYAFEDWWARLRNLIGQADTIIFVLSPDAVASEVCANEVEHAASLNKRFAPIVYRRVPDSSVPETLRRLNFVFFDDDSRFDASADRLAKALETDIEWIRRHTQFGEFAQRWQAAGRPGPAGLMLRPPLLNEAETWLSLRPRSAPEPTETLTSFIAESRQAYSLEEARKAEQILALRKATCLGFLPMARDAFDKGHFDHALRHVLAGAILADDSDFSLVPDMRPIAVAATMEARHRLVVKPGGKITSTMLSPDGSSILTIDNRGLSTGFHSAEICSGQTGARLYAFADDDASALAFSPSGDQLLVRCEDGTLRLSAVNGDAVRKLGYEEDEGEAVRFAVFSVSGRLIALAGLHKCIIVDAATGATRGICGGHHSPIRSVSFSPDETKLVTTSGKLGSMDEDFDSTARVWDAASGTQLAIFTGHQWAVSDASFCAGGTRVLSTSYDSPRLWDAATGELLTEFEHDGLASYGLGLSPDGTMAVCGEVLRRGAPEATTIFTAKVWDVGTGKIKQRLRGHADNITSAAFSRDGSKIVTASRDGAAHVYELGNEKPVIRLGNFGHPVISARFSPDDRMVLTAGAEGAVRLWDVVSNRPIATARMQQQESLLAIAPRGGWLATRYAQKRKRSSRNVVLRNLVQPDARIELDGKQALDDDAVFSDDGAYLAVDTEKKGPVVWNTATHEYLGKIDGLAFGNRQFMFSPDGRFLALTGRFHDNGEDTLQIWSVDPFKKRYGCDELTMYASCFCFSADSRFLAACSFDAVLRIWDLESGTESASLAIAGPEEDDDEDEDDRRPSRGEPVATQNSNLKADRFSQKFRSTKIELVMFSPKGDRILFCSKRHTAEIWDASLSRRSGRLEFDASLDSSTVGAFAPDGSQVALSRGDGKVHLFDLAKIEHPDEPIEGEPWEAHDNSVCAIAFSADGGRIVTASEKSSDDVDMGRSDVGIRVWDARTQEELLAIKQASEIKTPRISSDGNRAWTIDYDAVNAWDLAPTEAVRGSSLMAAALVRLDGGGGRLFERDTADPMMKIAPQDLLAAAREQWPELANAMEHSRTILTGR